MALFPERMPTRARKAFDTADIVRDVILHQACLGSPLAHQLVTLSCLHIFPASIRTLMNSHQILNVMFTPFLCPTLYFVNNDSQVVTHCSFETHRAWRYSSSRLCCSPRPVNSLGSDHCKKAASTVLNRQSDSPLVSGYLAAALHTN
jgi:hypothetical protein